MPNYKADHNAVHLHTDHLYKENQVLGVLSHKEGSMKRSDCIKKNKGRMSGKRKVKMLAAGKILEVVEDPREQGLT